MRNSRPAAAKRSARADFEHAPTDAAAKRTPSGDFARLEFALVDSDLAPARGREADAFRDLRAVESARADFELAPNESAEAEDELRVVRHTVLPAAECESALLSRFPC